MSFVSLIFVFFVAALFHYVGEEKKNHLRADAKTVIAEAKILCSANDDIRVEKE